MPGAVSLLNALQGKVKMGIITNGFTSLQQTRLERTGLRDHFDLLIISEQVGVAAGRAYFSIMRWRRRVTHRARGC